MSACKLSECQGKPRCQACLAMDYRYASPESRLAASVSHALDECWKGATEIPSRGGWDDGYVEGVKAVITCVRAALVAPAAQEKTR